MDVIVELLPRVVDCIQRVVVIRRHTGGLVDAGAPYRHRRVPLEECGEPGLTRPLQGVQRHSTTVVAQFSHVFAQVLLSNVRAAPTGVYTSMSSMAISSSSVSSVCGPHMAGTTTLPVTLFAAEVEMRPDCAAALLIISSLSLMASAVFLALYSSTMWRGMGKSLIY